MKNYKEVIQAIYNQETKKLLVIIIIFLIIEKKERLDWLLKYLKN